MPVVEKGTGVTLKQRSFTGLGTYQFTFHKIKSFKIHVLRQMVQKQCIIAEFNTAISTRSAKTVISCHIRVLELNLLKSYFISI